MSEVKDNQNDQNSIKFVKLLVPEILLAHIDIDNNDWVNIEKNWHYKVDQKDISTPFQRKLYILENNNKTEPELEILLNISQQNNSSVEVRKIKFEQAEILVRKILNLKKSTPIEDWTNETENRSLLDDIIASNHIKILYML